MRRWPISARAFHAGLALWILTFDTAAAGPVAATPHDLLPQAVRDAGVIIVATDAHHPPCESFADDNVTMVGFEPDLWNAMAHHLGVRVRAVSVDFDGLIPGVLSGRYQVAMECMSDSAEREREVSFVDYAYATNVVYTLDSSPAVAGAASLCGLSAGAQVGTDFVDSLKALSKTCTDRGKASIAIKQFPSGGAVLLSLYSRRVDFILNDEGAASELKKNSPQKLRVTDVGLPMVMVGASVRSGDKELAHALLAALRQMHADGSYDGIMTRWDLKPLVLAQPGINLATAH